MTAADKLAKLAECRRTLEIIAVNMQQVRAHEERLLNAAAEVIRQMGEVFEAPTDDE